MNRNSSEFWELYDRLRREEITDPWQVMAEARTRGIAVRADDARAVIARSGTSAWGIAPPDYLVRFMVQFLSERERVTLCDPWARPLGLLSAVATASGATKAIGMCHSHADYDAARSLHPEHPFEWHLREQMGNMKELVGRANVALSILPLNSPVRSPRTTIGGRSSNLRALAAVSALLDAAALISSSGIGLFVMVADVLQNNDWAVDKMAEHAVGLHAILSLPKDAFASETRAPMALVVVRPEVTHEVFLGEIPEDQARTAILVGNLSAWKQAKTPHLGVIVPSVPLQTLPQVIVARSREKQVAAFGYPPQSLGRLGTITLPKRDARDMFEDRPNAVYIPILGTSPAVSSISDFHIKAQNYAQVELDPERALAGYVAEFFNSQVGQGIRRDSMRGFIPKLNKLSVHRLEVYLPDLDTQAELIRVQSEVRDSRTELATLERRLWDYPRRCAEVARALRHLNREESLEEWMETLPFPIASILWIYVHDPAVEKRIEHLLNFFEACAEFQAAILLSGYRERPDLLGEEPVDEFPTPKWRGSYPRADFGTWIRVHERVGKAIRECLNSQTNRAACRQAFAMASEGFLEMISGMALLTLLKEVGQYRNRWKGHGGIVGPKEAEHRLDTLSTYLSRFRSIVQDRYADFLLLLPGRGDFDGEVYAFTVSAIIGTRTPFRRLEVASAVPLTKTKLYMRFEAHDHPVEFACLILLLPTPATERSAVYFYNRVEGETVRWVSYHYDEDYEEYRPLSEVASVLELVRAAGAEIRRGKGDGSVG